MNETTSDEVARPVSPPVRVLITFLAVALTGASVAYSLDLYRMVGMLIYTEQYLGGMLAIALPLVYLQVPMGKTRARSGPVPWYDIAAALVGFAAATFTAINFPDMVERIAEAPLDALIVSAILIVLIVEGVRRTVGNVLMLVTVFFLGFALIGHLVPGTLAGREVPWDKLVLYLGWDPTAILGVPMRIVTTIVVAFVFFGQLLFASGGSAFFTDISMVLMGRYRGGPAKIAVFASSLFGSISGSVVSNVLTTGVVTIPLMRKGGYKAHDAGAIEAVASTGGQLMPPIMGAAAFLMAEFLQVDYSEVVLAALIPSILYYIALFVQADLEAVRSNLARVPEDQIPTAAPILKSGWYFPLPFAALVIALFIFNYSPEASALYSAVIIVALGMLLGYRGKRLSLRDIFDAIRQTGITVIDIVMIGGAVGIVIGVLNISGLGFGLTLFLVEVAGGDMLTLLLVSAVVCIILGMGMPTVGVYVLLATLVAPALIEVGVNEMAAHMFIMYFGMMSMITPPVAIGAFAAATLTGADPMRTGFAAMRFGWLAFVIPFMFVGSQTLLMAGEPWMIAIDFIGAVFGAWFVSVAMMGHFKTSLGAGGRIIFAVSGIGLLTPLDAVPHAGMINLVGLVLAIGILTNEYLLRPRRALQT
jgi:TRAP transporter 4TM/12TM fusion protein